MADPTTTQAWIAFASTVAGGGGLKLIERVIARSKAREKESEATSTIIRTELRGEVADLKRELRTLGEDLDEWKDKYYKLLEAFMEAKSMFATVLTELGKNPTEVNKALDIYPRDDIQSR